MLSFSQQIKLQLFKISRNSYKKKLFAHSSSGTEFQILQFLLKKLNPLFIDVGANKGEFIYVAEKSVPPGKIWAFEPLPYFAEKLRALFPKVRVFKMALSDKEQNTTLYMPVKNGIPDDSLSSVYKPDNEDFISYSISCNTLDNMIKQYPVNDNILLKIDVEGHELDVLKGANKTLPQVQVMLVEIEERYHSGKPLKDMIAEIEAMGYACFYLHPQKNKLVSYDENTGLQNITHLNTPFYVNNFWFFTKQNNPAHVVEQVNANI